MVLNREKRISVLAVKERRTLARRLVCCNVAIMTKGCNLERKERKEKIRPETAGTRKKSGLSRQLRRLFNTLVFSRYLTPWAASPR